MKLPKISLTWKIIIGIVGGISLGWRIHKLDISSGDHHVFGMETQTVLGFARSLSTLFLNLIKSIIAPLIFATLVVGIAGTGDIKQVGRIGVKALVYFEIVTTLALFIGLAAVNITRPGEGVSLEGTVKQEKDFDKADWSARAKFLTKESNDASLKTDELLAQSAGDPAKAAKANAQAAVAAQKSSEALDAITKGLTAGDPPSKPQTFGNIISHLSPTSIIKTMADGHVLGILVFSVIFALAVNSIRNKAKPVLTLCQS